MPEHRAREHHRNRVQETLREEIGVIIDGELSDPRIGSATVTEVVLQPGGKSGHVYIAVTGDEAAENNTLEGLVAARGYIRSELLERMGVRHLPELSFHIDRAVALCRDLDVDATGIGDSTVKVYTGPWRRDVIRERGAVATTLEDVMARTATSKSQLFHYFPDGKEQLLLAVAEQEAALVLSDQQPYLSQLTSWTAW